MKFLNLKTGRGLFYVFIAILIIDINNIFDIVMFSVIFLAGILNLYAGLCKKKWKVNQQRRDLKLTKDKVKAYDFKNNIKRNKIFIYHYPQNSDITKCHNK